MGMSASQVRFLQLTDRKHDISRELQHLSMEKMSLTRDMQAVTREYQAALSSKTMKWSNNSGVSYADISYSTLMTPNASNMKSPILVSNSCGKIVLNKKYQKYAQMMDDKAGGKWEGSVRSQILSELTGINQADIDKADKLSGNANTAAIAYNEALEEFDTWAGKETSAGGAGTKYLTVDKLAENLGTAANGADLAALYKRGENSDYYINSLNGMDELVNSIKNNMSKYFIDDELLGVKDKTAFEEACDSISSYYKTLMAETGESSEKLREFDGVKDKKILGTTVGWYVDISKVFNKIMEAYVINGSYDYQSSNKEQTYPLRDTSTTEWKEWYEGYKTRKQALEAATSNYDKSMTDANMVMTAEQESKLKYYDLLFQAVADNGWTYDGQIEDSEYLNQMFQNNNYYVTTITENACYDESLPTSLRNYKYEYDTNTANNFDNIVTVNDSDARTEALVNYEYKKGIINAKESRIDTRMKNLETEQSAISKMLESIDKVKSDNIERTFGIWG